MRCDQNKNLLTKENVKDQFQNETKSARERLHSCELYMSGDSDLVREMLESLELLYDFNQTRPSELKKRESLLRQMFADIGEECYIEPPLHANWAGRNVHFGKGVYANFGLTLVDDTHIYVGDYTMFGPNVVVATAGHPVYAPLRTKGYQYNSSISIGKCCWIGANASILPGVTIGDNVVIGAGSVVTKDIPSNVIAVGNPCRVLRSIDEGDVETFFKGKRIDWETITKESGIEKSRKRGH